MNHFLPYDNMPAEYTEDKPFRMSTPDHSSLPEIEDRSDSLLIAPHAADPIPFPRNIFLAGVCLALPVSGLLWLLIIYVL